MDYSENPSPAYPVATRADGRLPFQQTDAPNRQYDPHMQTQWGHPYAGSMQLPPLRYPEFGHKEDPMPVYRPQADPMPSSSSRVTNLPPHSHEHTQAQNPYTLPLPGNGQPDAELTHPPTVAAATGHSATSKAGGSRRKKAPSPGRRLTAEEKGKAKRKRSPARSDSDNGSDEDDTAVPTTHGGRRAGAGNYREDDIDHLLDLAEKMLPLAQKGWLRLAEKFKVWAKANNRPVRDAKSLETKFKMLAKQTKPTGSGKRPAAVTRAKHIDKLMNERVSTRDLNDSDFDNNTTNNNDEEEDDDVEIVDEKPRKVVIRSSKSDLLATSRRAPRSNPAHELMHQLVGSINPSAQQSRDEERSARSFQNTHILLLNQQLRDANTTIDKLRDESTALREQVHKLERLLDRAEMEYKLATSRPTRESYQTRARGARPESTLRDSKIRSAGRTVINISDSSSSSSSLSSPSSSLSSPSSSSSDLPPTPILFPLTKVKSTNQTSEAAPSDSVAEA